jgi:hypothetical protein
VLVALMRMACISSDLAAKRLQLMQEIVPGLSRVAVLFNGGVPAKVEELREITAAAKTLEIEVQPVDIRDPSGITPAFAAMKVGSPQALIALSEPLTFYHVKEIAELAAEQRLPSTYGFREYCDAGGLLCYGASVAFRLTRVALETKKSKPVTDHTDRLRLSNPDVRRTNPERIAWKDSEEVALETLITEIAVELVTTAEIDGGFAKQMGTRPSRRS